MTNARGLAEMSNSFNRIFKENLKINMRSISVKTLLSDRNLSRIDYKPYYQRNYVWDNSKATFFIESVFLGTDIPPLILFKSGKKVEVIDGRQRFETLKRFKENSFKLTGNGLVDLKILKDHNFNELKPEIKDIFLDTKVRLFEFEVVNEPELSPDIEDKIKKEIFRRYNTGITPISSAELDNARYDDDPLSHVIKESIESDHAFTEAITACFFSNRKGSDLQLSSITDFIRRYIIMPEFPIYSYASSGSRTDIRELLYQFTCEKIEDHHDYFLGFKKLLCDIIDVHAKIIAKNPNLNNKLIYESLLWGFTLLTREEIDYKIDENTINAIVDFMNANLSYFSLEDAHYYKNIVERFEKTAQFFSTTFSVNLSSYIKDEDFKDTVNSLRQTESDGLTKMNALEKLRFLKPEPSSEPIEEIISDLNTNRYMIRPSYQRQERINIIKASAIIESILLGVYLPPIFIFKNKDGIKEVIDGQQRLLSILGFMGKQYLNESGRQEYSKNNNFSLKGLKVLTELNGCKFSDLSPSLSEKIFDFDLTIIEIDYKINENFEPVDLFIRLNSKPYPIKENSFEMWNSTVNKDIIKTIKDIVNDNVSWFYVRKTNEDRSQDRMDNEEMITVLSYLDRARSTSNNHNGVEFYLKQDRLNCRIKNKSAITAFLNGLDSNPIVKEEFYFYITRTKKCIALIKKMLQLEFNALDDSSLDTNLNNMLNVKNVRAFRRNLQDVYILWILMRDLNEDTVIHYHSELIRDISILLSKMKNTENVKVDEDYMLSFNRALIEINSKYTNYMNSNN
ncbi:DUF262 domain-containing protein [Aeromonas caviae]